MVERKTKEDSLSGTLQNESADNTFVETDANGTQETTTKVDDRTLRTAHTDQIDLIDLATPKLDLTGRTLDGRYKILSPLGEGGMSTVYKAEHLIMNAVRAVKVIHPKLMGDEQSLRRFHQEAESISKLQHASIIAVHDCGVTEDGRPYIAMDFIEGRSLADVLRDEEYLERERALDIFVQLTDALESAHKMGIIHRDLKPSNIMLTKNVHGEERAKILDFGVAKVITDDAARDTVLTQTGEIFGSPLYMSPEQCQGARVDHKSDIYALGCVMYECMTGLPPIRGTTIYDTIRRQVSEIPPRFQQMRPKLGGLDRLEAIVFKCLEKDPSNRFAGMSELHQELLPLRSGARTDWRLVASAAHDLFLLDLKLLFNKRPGGVAMSLICLAVFGCLSITFGAWLAEPLVMPSFDGPEKLWQANFKPELPARIPDQRNVAAIEQLHQLQELLLLHGRKRESLQRDFLQLADLCYRNGEYDAAQGYYAQAGHNMFPGDHFVTDSDMIRCFNRAADLLFVKGEYRSALGFYEKAVPMLDIWSEIKPTAFTPVYTRAGRCASLAGTKYRQLENGRKWAQRAVEVIDKDKEAELALAMTVAADLNRQLAINHASQNVNFGVLENSDQQTTMLNYAARMYSQLMDFSFVSDRPQRDVILSRFCHGLVHEKLGNWKVAAEDFKEVYPELVNSFGRLNPISRACLIKEGDALWKSGDQIGAVIARLKAKLR